MNQPFISLIDSDLATTPTTPGQLALALHMSGSTELKILLPENWNNLSEVTEVGYSISHGYLSFASQGDRNRILAEKIFTQHFTKPDFDVGALFAIARKLWTKEIGHTDFASGRLLVEVARYNDVLQLAAQQIRNGADTFDVLHVLGAYFVHAENLNIASLIDLTYAQHDGTKHDYMAGMFYDSLEKWLATRTTVAHALYTKIADAPDEVTTNLISTALISISRTDPDKAIDLSIGLLTSPLQLLQNAGRWMCGIFLLQSNIPIPRRTEIENIILVGLRSSDTNIRQASIRAATAAIHLTPIFDEALAIHANAEDQDALISIANALFLKSTDLQTQGRFYSWLPFLVALVPAEDRVTGGLDYVLSQHLEDTDPHQSEIIEFLTMWTLRHSKNTPIENTFAERFDQCMYKLAEQPNRFSTVLTGWLTHDSHQLASAVAGILSQLEVSRYSNVKLDPVQLNVMDASELQFLVRRVLGYVHNTKYLISMSLSFLQMEDNSLEKTLPLLGSLIVNEIGYDYPGTTVEALQQAELGESRQAILSVIQAWRTAIQASQEVLKKLPRLNELRPSSQLQRQFAIARDKQMNRAREDASKKSIMRQISTQIPLKAGRRFFNHTRGEYSEPTALNTISYSLELPRREILDPVGNAIRGFQFRNIKKNM